MKKLICMMALAGICYGTVYAAVPVQMQDTTKTKMKKKGTKMKVKKKTMKKDSTMKM